MKMDGTGPEGKGPKTGRKLGRCKRNSTYTLITGLGEGQGKRRKSGGGTGKGKRVRRVLK